MLDCALEIVRNDRIVVDRFGRHKVGRVGLSSRDSSSEVLDGRREARAMNDGDSEEFRSVTRHAELGVERVLRKHLGSVALQRRRSVVGEFLGHVVERLERGADKGELIDEERLGGVEFVLEEEAAGEMERSAEGVSGTVRVQAGELS